MRNTCEKYSKIQVPYKYKKVIDQLSRNRDLCILKQDKGRGVVLMDRNKYTGKCLELLQTNQFMKLNHDPTKSIEGKIQRMLRKVKNRLSSKEYYQLYPTGSCAGKFYGTLNINKVPPNGFIDNLPQTPIVSNIGTASYQLTKYLAKFLSPLAKSNYTINRTNDLMIKIKNEKIPENYEMVSFDGKSLFTSVPLEHTIDIAIKRIDEKDEITSVFTKNEMKKLLTICTRNVHFSFNNDIYIQTDGIAMSSPFCPVLANIFMVELESVLVPKFNDHAKKGRRFVDDAFAYVKRGSIEYVLPVLNLFHDDIKFTYEQDNSNRLPFLMFYLLGMMRK